MEFELPVVDTVPFLICSAEEQVSWEVPLTLAKLSPCWNVDDLDKLPITVQCAPHIFQEFLIVAETGSWTECQHVEAVQDLAIQYRIQLPGFVLDPDLPASADRDLLPDPMLDPLLDQMLDPLPDPVTDPVPVLQVAADPNADPESLLDDLFQADDLTLAQYLDHPNPLVKQGCQALLLGNKIQALLANFDPAQFKALLPTQIHPLLQRRLILLAEYVYDSQASYRAQFFQILGQL